MTDRDFPSSASDEAFPVDGTGDQVLRAVLGYAVQAPSGHNTQPWSFDVHGGALRVYADRSRGLPVADPHDRELVISCGAAVAFARVALRRFGYAGDVTCLPDPADPDLLATIRLGSPHRPTEDDEALFAAIETRHTHRAAFEQGPLAESVLELMRRDAEQMGAALVVVDEADVQGVADLVAAADRVLLADRAYRAELSRWLRPNRSTRRDGIPGYALGMGDVVSLLAPWVVRHLAGAGRQADADHRSASTAPALAAVVTAGDAPADWLAAGQALGLLLLRGAAEGVQASFLNQPVQVAALRPRLGELLGESSGGQVTDPGHPQVLVRMGYAVGGRSTPRREPPMVESVRA